MDKIVKISLAGMLLFSVIFMNVSNKNIGSNSYFLETKKDNLIDVECEDSDNKDRLEKFFNKKIQKKLDNVNVENDKNNKKDKDTIDFIFKNKNKKNNLKKSNNVKNDKNDLVKFSVSSTADTSIDDAVYEEYEDDAVYEEYEKEYEGSFPYLLLSYFLKFLPEAFITIGILTCLVALVCAFLNGNNRISRDFRILVWGEEAADFRSFCGSDMSDFLSRMDETESEREMLYDDDFEIFYCHSKLQEALQRRANHKAEIRRRKMMRANPNYMNDEEERLLVEFDRDSN